MRTIKCLYAISVLVVVVLTSCAYRPKVIVESESIVVESHIDSSYLGNTLVYEVHLASFANCFRLLHFCTILESFMFRKVF